MRKAKVNINNEKLQLSSEILRALAAPPANENSGIY